jgi:hypothetical protein
MSPAGRQSSPWRIAACLFAEFTGFAALLFITRFVARGHLVPRMDQECHIGGIAIDVLAHGVRFPLLVYAPNDYDNGSFFSGLLAAVSFSLLGRRVLALKLVTHLISAASAVATLWLLRRCLEEVGLTSRLARWTATVALVVAIALAPRVVTLVSTYAVGNHAEGSAIDTLLLVLFARGMNTRSATRAAALWALVGFGLYLNKGTVLVIPLLGAAELVVGWRSFRRLAAAFGGLVLGSLPELLVILQRHGGGWATIASKAERNVQGFPYAFIDDVLALADHRIELLAGWALALSLGVALLVRSLRYGEWRHDASSGAVLPSFGSPPVTLALVVGLTCLHLAALTVMAQGGLDAYAVYEYPTLVVLFSVLVAAGCAHAAARWGERAGTWVGVTAIGLTLVLYRPDAVSWGFATVSTLWRDRAGAACAWRFAEGFEREHDNGLAPPGGTREQYAIARCRSLSEQSQVLDCIGGIARELNWRQHGTVPGEPPAGLSAPERRAYAYYYGTHRKGDATPCSQFSSPELTALCAAAVQLECLHFGDIYTRIASGHGLGRPRCAVTEAPMDGYWASLRLDLLTRTGGTRPDPAPSWGDEDLRSCQAVLDECY